MVRDIYRKNITCAFLWAELSSKTESMTFKIPQIQLEKKKNRIFMYLSLQQESHQMKHTIMSQPTINQRKQPFLSCDPATNIVLFHNFIKQGDDPKFASQATM